MLPDSFERTMALIPFPTHVFHFVGLGVGDEPMRKAAQLPFRSVLAAEATLPAEPLLIYCDDAIPAEAVEQAAARLRATCLRKPRPVAVIVPKGESAARMRRYGFLDLGFWDADERRLLLGNRELEQRTRN